MPASRSRTERWKDCLHQILERRGGIEIAVGQPGTSDNAVPDVMWRVRVIAMSEHEIVVEQPAAAGQTVPLPEGTPVVGVMSIGQNRWMFRSKVLTSRSGPAMRGAAVVLEMPTNTERCQRREHQRVATAGVSLPGVECWPLLNPTSVGPAEYANRALILDLARTGGVYQDGPPVVMPDVGAPFSAHLGNIGGGGLGLVVDKSEAGGLGRSPLVWMRLDLRPTIPAPLAITGRIAHSHLDHEHHLHLGVAFDFSFNSGHRDFVVSQIQSFVSRLTTLAARAA
ncbi:MAG: flagellar brake protein [Phycisphaerales bacterium]